MSGKHLAGVFVGAPLLMFSTKIARMDARDEHELMLDVRYKAIFWERATEFSRDLSARVMDSVLQDPERARVGEAMP